ncbi:MAG TPA: hypothetical protein VK590_08560 [Saprospiraceae bacterium]|nr:hypothetical protein [Saprospiraceae bacterium]
MKDYRKPSGKEIRQQNSTVSKRNNTENSEATFNQQRSIQLDNIYPEGNTNSPQFGNKDNSTKYQEGGHHTKKYTPNGNDWNPLERIGSEKRTNPTYRSEKSPNDSWELTEIDENPTWE